MISECKYIWCLWKKVFSFVQVVSVFQTFLAKYLTRPSENVSSMWVCSGFFWQAAWLMRLSLKMCQGSECVQLASSGKLHDWWGSIWKCVQRVSVFFFWQAVWLMSLWKCVQRVSVFWLLLASCISDEAPSKMCPESECVLASSGKLCDWWGSLWKCVQGVSVFWLLLASCMADEASSENVSSKWVCSFGKLHSWWGSFWKCVQAVSVFWLLLASCMTDEASSENVSSMWVCSGFWQAAWLMRIPLKICPVCECDLASSGKLHGWWGSLWKCVQYVSLFWLLLASCMADEALSENVSSMWVCSGFFWQAAWLMTLLRKMCPVCESVLLLLASCMADEAPSENVSRMWVCSGFFWQDGWWGSFWKCVQQVSVFWLLLSRHMADEAPSENLSREWVCSGFFWQAA